MTLRRSLMLGLSLAAPALFAQQSSRLELGRLQAGATVSFSKGAGGEWGIEITGGGAPRVAQPLPAEIEIYRGGEKAVPLASGYRTVTKEAAGVVAKATLKDSAAAFSIEDHWKIAGGALQLSRRVSVTAAEPGAGFYSAIRLVTDPKFGWSDADYLVPGLLYGEPHNSANGPAGSQALRAKRLNIREDYLSAPLFALSFRDGHWAAVMDLAPKGETTEEETTASANTPIVSEGIGFGAVGAREAAKGGIEYGFWLPGTTNEFQGGFGFGGGRGNAAPPAQIVRRRYHPVKDGFAHSYQVGFKFGEGDSFRSMQRNAWRWAWQSLSPKVKTIDVDSARRALIDHLASQVLTYEGRSGIPFVIDAQSGRPGSFRPAYVLRTRGGAPPPPTLSRWDPAPRALQWTPRNWRSGPSRPSILIWTPMPLNSTSGPTS